MPNDACGQLAGHACPDRLFGDTMVKPGAHRR